MTLFGLRGAVRSAEPGLLDTFLVAAVGTVLVIRLFLEATGYPRLGGGELHIAHVLWGGLGMLVAFLLLLGFVSSATRPIAALVGGAGFGAFIDEFGKFVTSDNNYFYRPTAAVVYVLFVLLFLVVRQLWRFRQLSPRESLVNAIGLAEDLVAGDLDEYERSRALDLLTHADQSEPLVSILRQRFVGVRIAAAPVSGLHRLRGRGSAMYRRVVTTTAFRRVLFTLFAIEGLVIVLGLIAVTALIAATALGIDVGRRHGGRRRRRALRDRGPVRRHFRRRRSHHSRPGRGSPLTARGVSLVRARDHGRSPAQPAIRLPRPGLRSGVRRPVRSSPARDPSLPEGGGAAAARVRARGCAADERGARRAADLAPRD